MKIIFKRGMSVEWVNLILKDFLNEVSEEYPVLKNTMTVNVSLRDYFEESPLNDRTFNFDFDTIKEYENKAKELTDMEFEEEWEHYLKYYNCNWLKSIVQKDYNYINTAKEKNRKPENVEKRKTLLKEHEEELEKEEYIIRNMENFKKLKQENKVNYEYEYAYFNSFTKSMIFEVDNIKYKFRIEYFNGNIIIGSGRILVED